eukprot:CAMPEP_0181128068 /NCGR_PEP_ID=MMETSP1071-20121207/28548_1 /TAXON_ID=35127 /ORGANISM="Thalassiosira sp., Strain NH16" /LENGTH=54 /DNA_ID=CAMNT_0023213877 /DNA_START=1 /DNA_END=162 /DNA_ORIENTATION=+
MVHNALEEYDEAMVALRSCMRLYADWGMMMMSSEEGEGRERDHHHHPEVGRARR